MRSTWRTGALARGGAGVRGEEERRAHPRAEVREGERFCLHSAGVLEGAESGVEVEGTGRRRGTKATEEDNTKMGLGRASWRPCWTLFSVTSYSKYKFPLTPLKKTNSL